MPSIPGFDPTLTEEWVPVKFVTNRSAPHQIDVVCVDNATSPTKTMTVRLPIGLNQIHSRRNV